MLTFCFMAIIHVLLIMVTFWIFALEIKLLLNKKYREYPPFIPSFGIEKKNIIKCVRNILKNSPSSMTVLDPGCGTGELIFELAKEFPNHKFIGIEWNIIIAKIFSFRARKFDNIKIICDNMFNHNFGNADIVTCFLMDSLMKKFGQKVLNDNKKPQTIISNTFKIPNLPLVKEIKTGDKKLFKNIYIYKL